MMDEIQNAAYYPPTERKSMSKYHGITHGIQDHLLESEHYVKWCKENQCSKGIHLFDEVRTTDKHYLHCDICGLEVHIERINHV